MKINDALIQQKLDAITDKDRFGQKMIFDQRLSALFPGQEEEAEKFCKTSKNFQVSTYGNRYVTYKAITKRI